MLNSFLMTGPNEFFNNAVREFFDSPDKYLTGFHVVVEHVHVEETDLFTGTDHYNVGFVSEGNWLLCKFDSGYDFCLHLCKQQVAYLQFYVEMYSNGDIGSSVDAVNQILVAGATNGLNLYRANPLPVNTEFEPDSSYYYDFKFEFEEEVEDMWLDSHHRPMERLYAEYSRRRLRLHSGKACIDEFSLSRLRMNRM